jgi:hypothetical protein
VGLAPGLWIGPARTAGGVGGCPPVGGCCIGMVVRLSRSFCLSYNIYIYTITSNSFEAATIVEIWLTGSDPEPYSHIVAGHPPGRTHPDTPPNEGKNHGACRRKTTLSWVWVCPVWSKTRLEQSSLEPFWSVLVWSSLEQTGFGAVWSILVWSGLPGPEARQKKWGACAPQGFTPPRSA